jgi:hypothetical protein
MRQRPQCSCGLSFAAHSTNAVIGLTGLQRSTINFRRKKYKLGQWINGQWHFTHQDIDRLKHGDA